MDFSISVDAAGRINGICPDDLSGGGWLRVPAERLTAHTSATVEGMFERLEDDHGAALYGWADGYAELRTPAERAADAPARTHHEPTLEERTTALEAAMMDALLGGVL